MLAKKSKHFIKPTSEDTNESISLVEDFVFFFYKKLKKDLSSLEIQEARIKRIGALSLSENKLNKAYSNRNNKLKYLKSERVIKEISEEAERIKLALDRTKELNKKKKEFKAIRRSL